MEISMVSGNQQKSNKVWLNADAGDFAEFRQSVEREASKKEYPLSAKITKNVPVYDGDAVRSAAQDETARKELMGEWARILGSGPGVVAIQGAYSDIEPIDRANQVFEIIIQKQRGTGEGGGDHFAKPGANDRIWNALEKHCLADPEGFVTYYGNIALAMVCEAWLGPGYQFTAQVNRVNPGGDSQIPHRDYHLGFMPADQITRYPAHIHAISPVLTLQGAVAHCDMPIESGPTMLLPYSQTFFEGYLAFGREEFQDYFAEHHIQMSLKTGDAVFFNPALIHGAGQNYSADIFRMANLLQISSAFGIAMEKMDRTRMCRAIYPELLKKKIAGQLSELEIAAAIASCADGYSFPTNLDTDPPVGGLAPKTQAAIMFEAVASQTETDATLGLLASQAQRRG